jgi:hypothetical protein
VVCAAPAVRRAGVGNDGGASLCGAPFVPETEEVEPRRERAADRNGPVAFEHERERGASGTLIQVLPVVVLAALFPSLRR